MRTKRHVAPFVVMSLLLFSTLAQAETRHVPKQYKTIQAGIDAAVNGAVPAGVAVDLAGSPRFVDDPVTPDTGLGIPPMVDMGAFEFQLIGDVSGDGAVNVLDLIIMLLDFGDCPDPPQGCPSDVNGDGTVDTIDLIILLANFG